MPVRNTLSPESVALRAYEIFINRGGEHGRDVQDWVRAEQELNLNSAAAPSKMRSSASVPPRRKVAARG